MVGIRSRWGDQRLQRLQGLLNRLQLLVNRLLHVAERRVDHLADAEKLFDEVWELPRPFGSGRALQRVGLRPPLVRAWKAPPAWGQRFKNARSGPVPLPPDRLLLYKVCRVVRNVRNDVEQHLVDMLRNLPR